MLGEKATYHGWCERVADERTDGEAGSRRGVLQESAPMSAEDLERYETEIELQLYQEYRAVLALFKEAYQASHAEVKRRPLYVVDQREGIESFVDLMRARERRLGDFNGRQSLFFIGLGELGRLRCRAGVSALGDDCCGWLSQRAHHRPARGDRRPARDSDRG